jgi:4-oxalocrotonate tautomerase
MHPAVPQLQTNTTELYKLGERVGCFVSESNAALLLEVRERFGERHSEGPVTQWSEFMPFVNVKLVEGVFSSEEKHAMAKALTDVMVKFEGSEAFREVVWVLIEELHTDGWHIGGRPFAGPRSLAETLSRSKEIFEAIDGKPTTRQEWAAAAPVCG